VRFWPARNEELDEWDLIDGSGEYLEDGGFGLFVPAFVEGVDDDEGRNAGGFERVDNDFLHLRKKRVLSEVRVVPQNGKQRLSELWVSIGELEGEGGEDVLNVAPVLEISRAEETRPELSIRITGLGERLGDGRLPGPRETVEPEKALGPRLSANRSICDSTSVLVPLRHSGLYPEEYPASAVWCIL
jgi:hypothetical protein